MNQEPKIGDYVDDEERELVEAIESEDYQLGTDALTPERLQVFKQAAQNTLNEERQKISLRVPRTDLARLKAKAMREGVPYQTAINSLIHKYVSG